jgi:transposase
MEVNMGPLYVGVDVSKDELAVSVWQQKAVQALASVPNTLAGFEQLAAQVQAVAAASQPIRLVLEPSGGYEWGLVAWAREQGWEVSLPNPLQVRRWAEGQGVRAKTDAVDSGVLARFGATQQPAPIDPLPAHVADLEHLLGRKQDLEKLLRQEGNRQHNLSQHPTLPAAVHQNLQQVVEALEKALAAIEAEIEALLDHHADLQAQRRLLLSVAGVGQKTVLDLLVFLHRWHVLTSGQGDAKGLTAYAGLDPTPYHSGTSVYKRPAISKQGDPWLRRQLVNAAKGGTQRGHSPLRQFYLRLIGRNKPKRLAWVAAARKILVWAWAVFRDQTPFQPHIALPDS